MQPLTTNILVTGANGGLGLGICLRLIDDFLRAEQATENLNIIFTTRSSRKSADTLKTLQSHLHRHHPQTLHKRISFQPESVELTNLLSIHALSEKLLSSDLTHINAIICNAGIGGWIGLDWFRAVIDVLKDLPNNTVWPAFKLGTIGSITPLQLPQNNPSDPEPPLGEVFCANLFGHYMLAHWLMPLLHNNDASDPSKIIWVSSIEPQAHHFHEQDLQGLLTDAPYEHGKRITDILALTSNQPTTAKSIQSFTSTEQPKNRKIPPTQHVYHPGIVVTSVISLYWIVHQAYMLGIYLARLCGSIWSTVEPYHAAHGATWLALTPTSKVTDAERTIAPPSTAQNNDVVVTRNGKVKWGTAIDRWGRTTVRPTEVEGWGLTGTGEGFAANWWNGTAGHGRRPGAVEATPDDVREFIALGGRLWERMEQLRTEWERRLNDSEKAKK